MPSPQYGALRHAAVHLPIPYAVTEFIAPRSHCSLPFLTPSPQYAASVQSGLHVPYAPLLTPLSHCSGPFLMPSPQRGPIRQSGVQWPSPPVLLATPSSHCSPGSITLSPHLSVQLARHGSLDAPLLMPSSHCSGPFLMPSPRGGPSVHAAVQKP